MKIAILGKGGSGKSSVSWLLTRHLSTDTNNRVLAIDADHNMDLTSCLGYEIKDSSNLFYKSNEEFRNLLGLSKNQRWQAQFEEEHKVNAKIKFNYNSSEGFLKKYVNPIQPNLDLLIVGLGEEDIMYTGMCSHGLSSPLKYLLPRLELPPNSFVVLDSVAGSDMVNYGLYFGFDVVTVVVEGHINSIKVARQLDVLLEKQGIQLYFILNKYNSENPLIAEFLDNPSIKNRILGNVPIDTNIINYDYSKLSSETKESLELIIQNMQKLPMQSSHGFELLKEFENKKQVIVLK